MAETCDHNCASVPGVPPFMPLMGVPPNAFPHPVLVKMGVTAGMRNGFPEKPAVEKSNPFTYVPTAVKMLKGDQFVVMPKGPIAVMVAPGGGISVHAAPDPEPIDVPFGMPVKPLQTRTAPIAILPVTALAASVVITKLIVNVPATVATATPLVVVRVKVVVPFVVAMRYGVGFR